MSTKVLITGALGYLGGRIADYLANQKEYELFLGLRGKRLIPESLSSSRCVTIDLTDSASLETACRGIDAIVHLAAMNEIDSSKDPELALQINGAGTLKLLQAAEYSGVKRFIYFSTAHVYGAPLVGTITEATLAKPVHPYAITHRTAEDFVFAAHTRKSMEGITVRLSNGFGAPLTSDVNRWTLVFNDLCRQAVETGQLKLQSSGLQRRDFITLHDVARGVHHLLGLSTAACGDGLFNLGGELPLRIIDVAERIQARCADIMEFTPALLRPEPEQGEVSNDLDYRIDKLKATGFKLTGNMDNEIDATLRLCLKEFRTS